MIARQENSLSKEITTMTQLHLHTTYSMLDGVGKAKIYTMNQDGRPAINSFAHGGSVYILEEDLFRDLTDEDIRDLAQNGISSKDSRRCEVNIFSGRHCEPAGNLGCSKSTSE